MIKMKLRDILLGLSLINKEYDIPVIYPVHPRTLKKLKEFELVPPVGISIIDPVGYLDFLVLEKNAKVVLTDSGGVQEECCVLKVPCVILRENNEWPELLSIGCSILVGTDPNKILTGTRNIINKRNWENPLGERG